MKKEQQQIEKFVQTLELKGLNEQEQVMVLTGQYGGMLQGYVTWLPCSSSNNKCTNNSNACGNSTNSECKNSGLYCSGATNSGYCTN